jgi:hypothetical protein
VTWGQCDHSRVNTRAMSSLLLTWLIPDSWSTPQGHIARLNAFGPVHRAGTRRIQRRHSQGAQEPLVVSTPVVLEEYPGEYLEYPRGRAGTRNSRKSRGDCSALRHALGG